MLRMLLFSLLTSPAVLLASDPGKLAAPDGWGGETIKLPPGFAPDMTLRGLEHIRFAPGMFKPQSDSFFSYAFVFELRPEPALTQVTVTAELLKYYRGLGKAVMGDKLGNVDPSTFKLELQQVKSNPTDAESPRRYQGKLRWVEPFATQEPQQLNLEIQSWSGGSRNFIFVCVSPQPRDAAIWKQLHAVRDAYLEK